MKVKVEAVFSDQIGLYQVKSRGKDKVISIQVLRAVACLCVLQIHFLATFPLKDFTFCGAIGVDLFFIISGFIIAASLDIPSVKNEGLTFLIKRFSRVGPYYYLLTIIFLFLLSLYNVPFDWMQFLESLLFLPQRKDPSLFLGWSLNHEVLFYLVIGILVIIFPRKNLYLYALIFASLVFIASLIPTSNYLVKFVGSNINFTFLMGFLSYPIYEKLLTKLQNPIFLAAAILLFITSAVISTDMPTNPDHKIISNTIAYQRELLFFYKKPLYIPRVLLWGGASFFLFITSLAQEKKLTKFKNSLIVKIGDASYSIYLIQGMFWIFKYYYPLPGLKYGILLVLILLIVSLFMYQYESKLANFTKKRLLRLI